MREDFFSPSEHRVLHIIGRRKMKIEEVAERYFGEDYTDTDDQNYIAGVVRRIARKCDRHKAKWTLLGEGAGRSGRKVWKGKRPGRSK